MDLGDSLDLGDLVGQEELEDLEDLLLELEVGMAQLLLLLVVLCQDSSAVVFQNDSARMSPDKFPGKSAKQFQNKNARVFQERHAEMFQDKYLDKNVNLSPQRSAPLFQGNHVNLFQGKCAPM